MLCRKADCAYRHPDLCADPACIPNRAPDCAKFHGRYKEESSNSANVTAVGKAKKGKKSTKRTSLEPAQGNGRRGAPPPNRPSTARSNNRRFPSSSAPRGAHPAAATTLNKSTRKELSGMKRELASIRQLGPNLSLAAPPVGSLYSDVVKASARAPQLGTFAAVFATALESALGSAGLRLASAY